MNRLSISLWLARISWAAIVLALASTLFSDLWKLSVLALIPMLLVWYGPIKGDVRGNQWAAFAVTPYFMYGVTEQTKYWMVPDIDPTGWPVIYWLGGSVLFVAAMMHSRWQAEANQQTIDSAEQALSPSTSAADRPPHAPD